MKKTDHKDVTALVLVRKAAFYQWLRKADQKSVPDEDVYHEGDHGVYLVHDLYTDAQIKCFVKSHFRQLMENELHEWHTQDLWPRELTFELFCEFFDVQVHRQVYELKNDSK